MMSYQHQHRRQSASVTAARLFLALVLVVILAAVFCLVQILRGAPSASASVVLPTELTTPGVAPTLPWPKQGSAALSVEGIGSLGGVNADTKYPLASVTKLFTALVVLKDHPLGIGQSGPDIPITAADAAAYRTDALQNDSVVAVSAGEQLSELQALEAMLIPSGDNIARILATWDAGSKAAFVAQMNAEASALGLHSTTLAGPSGLSPASVSTAADMVRVAAAVMSNQVLANIVSMPQVTLPVAGLVYNYNYALGHDGIIGIKTGSTPSDGGNFVFAAEHHVDGHLVTVLGAVLHQGGVYSLQHALDVGERLSAAVFAAVRSTTVITAGREVIAVRAPWSHTVLGRAAESVSVLALPGERVHVEVTKAPVLERSGLDRLSSGETLGTVDVTVNGKTIPDAVIASGSLRPASLGYRLTDV
jgi:D-alanyl-D-alanine carboxypeptidase (penicillin-binding protein 5/6)